MKNVSTGAFNYLTGWNRNYFILYYHFVADSKARMGCVENIKDYSIGNRVYCAGEIISEECSKVRLS